MTSSTGAYFVGQQVRLTATFRNEAGEPIDPSIVIFKVIDGEPTLNGELKQIDYADPTRVSAGVWEQTITLTCSGTWRYRVEGTGALIAAAQKAFGVEPDPFA